MKIKAIIVEDSRLARNELKLLTKSYDVLEVVAEAENVDQALSLIEIHRPDLLFLDINMPGKSGFDLLEMLDDVPKVIFTTAYDQYAIKSFEYNAFDYLLKPIAQERFDKTMDKIIGVFEHERSSKTEKSLTSQIFVKDGDRCWMVKLGDLEMFEVEGNYTRVFFHENKVLIYKSLQKIIETLPSGDFFRANRQQVINVRKIKEISPWFSGNLKVIMENGNTVEISRRQSSAFKEMLSL